MDKAGSGGGGGGEVRKIHVVYFLSRKGLIEHPHLIRVHHLSRTGVHLRDVKRWLSELRGKDMPESFAWSYKRKYKAGYVWQDLLDEDLITPISDNEYVLKGSEISSITFNHDFSSYSEKDDSKTKSTPSFEFDIKDRKTPLAKESQDHLTNSSTKTSFEIEEPPSFGSETSTEDTPKQQEDYHFVDTTKHEEVQSQKKTEVNSLLETYLSKIKNDDKIKKSGSQKEANGSNASRSSNYSFEKSSSYSGSGATHTFLNLITCGIVDTDDSAMVIKRKDGNVSFANEKNIGHIAKGDNKFGWSSRGHWTTLEKQSDTSNLFSGHFVFCFRTIYRCMISRIFSYRKEGSKTSHNVNDSSNKKTIPAAYKFVNGPYCSQCGRQFNPEKLHTHMKSCRRMKAIAKAAKSISERMVV
ncbi:protein SOSEKI 1-like [Bidens hawaiensis]|uniref:protein SOSEKI 1-like n=1 Tax=Bidens hawaiensis TaxID=980011 RepID=UPI00404AD2BF